MKRTIIFVVAIVAVLGLAFTLTNDDPADPPGEQTVQSLRLSDIHGLEVDINNPDRLYLPNHQGLYVQEDDGNIQKIGDISDDLMSFAVSRTDEKLFYTSGHPKSGGNFGLISSTDSGTSWEDVSEGLNGPVDFHSMAVDAIDDQRIYGYYQGALQRSLDGGATWEYLEDAPDQIIQLSSGAKDGQLYAATTSGLFMSDDMGQSWTQIDFADEAVLAIEPVGDDGAMVAYGSVSGLQISNEGASTWLPVEFDQSDPVLYIAAAPSDHNKVYLVTKSLTIYESNDNAETWEKR